MRMDYEMKVPGNSAESIEAKIPEPNLRRKHVAVLRERFINEVTGEIW